jgi:hypothetical protein
LLFRWREKGRQASGHEEDRQNSKPEKEIDNARRVCMDRFFFVLLLYFTLLVRFPVPFPPQPVGKPLLHFPGRGQRPPHSRLLP